MRSGGGYLVRCIFFVKAARPVARSFKCAIKPLCHEQPVMHLIHTPQQWQVICTSNPTAALSSSVQMYDATVCMYDVVSTYRFLI